MRVHGTVGRVALDTTPRLPGFACLLASPPTSCTFFFCLLRVCVSISLACAFLPVEQMAECAFAFSFFLLSLSRFVAAARSVRCVHEGGVFFALSSCRCVSFPVACSVGLWVHFVGGVASRESLVPVGLLSPCAVSVFPLSMGAPSALMLLLLLPHCEGDSFTALSTGAVAVSLFGVVLFEFCSSLCVAC